METSSNADFVKEIVPPSLEDVSIPRMDFKPLKTLGEMTVTAQYEPPVIGWNVEYTGEMFPETMTKKERAAINMEGYVPITNDDGEVVGRAYLSKFEPVEKNKEQPTAEIRVIPRSDDTVPDVIVEGDDERESNMA